MKRIILLLLVFLLLVPVNAHAQKSYTNEDKYKYKGVIFSYILKDNEAIIIGFNNAAKEVQIPSEITKKKGKTYPVHSLNIKEGFALSPSLLLAKLAKSIQKKMGNTKTTSIIIEPGIKRIEELCFSNFKNLSQVTIPNTIEYIGKEAFPKGQTISYTLPSTIREDDLVAGLPISLTTGGNGANHPDYAANDIPASQTTTIQQQPSGQERAASTPITSDVDINIPSTSVKRENTFCLVIGNETYQQRDTPNVKFAQQDSKTFSEYCIHTLGVPEKQVRNITNATYIQFIEGLRWLKKIAGVYGNEANYIVYYAGHGIPDEKGNCCLLPTDVSINDVENGFNLSELYQSLGSLTTKNVLVLIDACFSGNDRNGDIAMNDEHRGVMIEVREEKVPKNVVVMTATSQKETALAYNEKGHGYFTYFLLKKLQETKGKVTFGELYDYIHREVSRKSVVNEQKTQTPSITTASQQAELWKALSF